MRNTKKPKNSSYWTDERLRDLERLMQTKKLGELCRHFCKSPEIIEQAMDFVEAQRKLLISDEVVSGVRIRVYKSTYKSLDIE